MYKIITLYNKKYTTRHIEIFQCSQYVCKKKHFVPVWYEQSGYFIKNIYNFLLIDGVSFPVSMYHPRQEIVSPMLLPVGQLGAYFSTFRKGTLSGSAGDDIECFFLFCERGFFVLCFKIMLFLFFLRKFPFPLFKVFHIKNNKLIKDERFAF